MPIQDGNQYQLAQKRSILVCQNTSCLAQGSDEILAALINSQLPQDIEVIAAPCQGQCSSGPTVRIIPEETWYCRVKPSDIPEIVEKHLWGGQRVEAKLNPRIHLRLDFGDYQ